MPRPSQEVRDAVRRAFLAARRTLAPNVPADEYARSMRDFRRRYSRILRTGSTAEGGRVLCRYEGIRSTRAALAEGKPVLFVAWHHGAVGHVERGVARAFPRTTVFTRRARRHGRASSVPMEGSAAFSLFRMHRLLSEGRPVLYHIDGPALGNTVELAILGSPATLAIGPIRILRSLPRARIIPVAACLRGDDTIEIKFHPPAPRLRSMTDRKTLASVLSCLEEDLRRRAPEQVGLDFLLSRDYYARVEPRPARP